MTPSINIFPHLESIAQPYNGILLDAYGVFWGGNGIGLLPGSKEAMEQLVSDGKCVGILSNTTQLASKEIDKLHRHGLMLGKHFHFMTTSGEVAKHIFKERKLPFETPKMLYWLFGGIHPRFSSHEDIFKGSDYAETKNILDADFIYISIPHINGEDQEDPEIFRDEVKKLRQFNLPMVCPNPDRFAHEGNPPRPVVRQGSIAALYKECGGQLFYIGKPSSVVYSTAMTYFQKHHINLPSKVLMVGDTPETDIRGAREFGMSSALIMRTGIFADRIEKRGFKRAMEGLSPMDTPNLFIETLGRNHGIPTSPQSRL
jgi:HAD superfamily hydrolase (TIGR01459 family)